MPDLAVAGIEPPNPRLVWASPRIDSATSEPNDDYIMNEKLEF